MSRRLTGAAWRLALRRRRRVGVHRFLRRAGYVILIVEVMAWFVLVGVGWLLVFLAADSAVLVGQDRVPASLTERVYYTGTTLTTLGIGDYLPGGVPWQLATVAASVNGFLAATFTISYLVPVASAVALKRLVGASITGVGRTPERLLVDSWTGRDFAGLDGQLNSITPSVTSLAQQHVQYPILDLFHSVSADTASGLSVAVLDESITLLTHGVAADCRPPPATLLPARRAVDRLLATLKSGLVTEVQPPPEPPRLGALRRAGIPCVDDETFRRAVVDLAQRRQLLSQLVRNEGWTWDDVLDRHPQQDQPDPNREQPTDTD